MKIEKNECSLLRWRAFENLLRTLERDHFKGTLLVKKNIGIVLQGFRGELNIVTAAEIFVTIRQIDERTAVELKERPPLALGELIS